MTMALLGGRRAFATFLSRTASRAPSYITRVPRSRIIPQLQTRQFSQTSTRERYNYQQFQATTHLLYRWANSPNFYYHIFYITAGASGFYIYNLEEVPVSGRRRFNLVSDAYVRQTSDDFYRQILREQGNKILPERHPLHQRVERVLQRLIPHSGLTGDANEWTVHVIDEDEKNAFVIPGGKVFVYTGILPVTQTDDGLAAVLGHEIAHNVANHVGEKMSQSTVLMGLGLVVSDVLGIGDYGVTRMAIDLGFLRPNGRVQESEADYIGLLMMSEACYDPTAAVGLWERMAKANENDPPEFLSTHPSSSKRMKSMEEWMPKAELKREQSGCSMLSSHKADFSRTFARFT